ncbi:hypothetical protein BDR26DRAFT_874879 [Obelidium mucronatum]|nr:hypothetical protein BDR26DRAFT_874875 [Obelidium mucronatum]KAI9327858.1 hypothetical protein BDR26DRAFT_874879 [Obelidium mucronatum]
MLNLCGSDVLLLVDISRAPGIHSSRAFHPPVRFLQALLHGNFISIYQIMGPHSSRSIQVTFSATWFRFLWVLLLASICVLLANCGERRILGLLATIFSARCLHLSFFFQVGAKLRTTTAPASRPKASAEPCLKQINRNICSNL